MRTPSDRIIERLTGRGVIEGGGVIICDVDYEIVVSKVITGNSESRGRLRVLEGKRDLIKNDLELRLEDGRKWKFIVTNGNPVSALYLVVQAGNDNLTPSVLSS